MNTEQAAVRPHLSPEQVTSTPLFLSPRSVLQALLLVISCLALMSLMTSIADSLTLDNYVLGELRESFVRLFTLEGETNVPAWYSSSMLLLCSLLLVIIGVAKQHLGDRYTAHWILMAVIFLYLSLDEAAQLHEMAIKPFRSLFNARGFFYFAWIIPGAAFVGLFVLTYFKFL